MEINYEDSDVFYIQGGGWSKAREDGNKEEKGIWNTGIINLYFNFFSEKVPILPFASDWQIRTAS